MPKVTVYNMKGQKVGEETLSDKVFAVPIKQELIWQAVIAQQAQARKVIAHTKGRAEVRGGGQKPWRQKGTGRARHGSIRSPIWRGGGVTFGPTKERSFVLKINKKAKRKALLMTLSDKATDKRIILLDKLELPEIKTKKMVKILENLKLREKKVRSKAPIRQAPLGLSSGRRQGKKKAQKKAEDTKKKEKIKIKSVLIVLPKKDQRVTKSARNLPKVETILADSLNVLEILKNQYLLMPITTVKKIEEVFG